MDHNIRPATESEIVEAQASAFKPYPEMVQALFKTMGSDSASIMHAAIGIAGETSELILAVTASNILNIAEELGDFRFYFQWLMTRFLYDTTLLNSIDPVDRYAEDELSLTGQLEDDVQFSVWGGDLLDQCKKYWIYGKPLDSTAVLQIMANLWHVYNRLLNTYGFTDKQIQIHNQAKLGKRYPEGVYSDAAAQARADKAA